MIYMRVWESGYVSTDKLFAYMYACIVLLYIALNESQTVAVFGVDFIFN